MSVARLKRKPSGSYHHPDLESALVEAAARTIAEDGVDALTLRGVGARLGVSRTALYRHFEDKAALLARVALDGFRRFRQALEAAVRQARAQDGDPIAEMAIAYVAFALENQSHYQVMFGGVVQDWKKYPDLIAAGEAAFETLERTIQEEQARGRIKPGDSLQMAHVVWAQVHGQAMLTLSGQFAPAEFVSLSRFGSSVLRDGMWVS